MTRFYKREMGQCAKTVGFRGVLFSIFVIASLLASVALPILAWTSFTSASSGAQIWTEDAEGNIKTDFEPNETVYIRGSGFNLNAQIEIAITWPDNTVDRDNSISNENGNFIYAYLLDGIYGTYYVTATDDVNSTSTTFDDRPKLQGFDKATGKWSSGNLAGWKELDWVPYRIGFKYLPEGTSSYTFNVYHNNLMDNKDGVDVLRDFHVGDENGNPVTGSVTVSGPSYKTPGKGCERDIYYALLVTFTTPSPRLNWYLYWQAHLAFGASGWPGASLHAYTDVSGSQDVPINVPPAPPGSISGSKWNDLNRDSSWDLGEPGLSGWIIQLYFFDPIENAWTHLADESTDSTGNYTFSGLIGGDYYLAEILQENWIQTYPPAGIHSITLSEGENKSGLDFGNFFAVRSVAVSILPNENSGPPRTMLSYIVTVTNTGDVEDNYDLTVRDNAGWGPALSDNSLTVPAGENRTATLSVTIPENAIPSTKDNIVVRATSQADNRVSAENSAIAHAAAFARGVRVSISPENQENRPGATLDYVVVITNEGDVVDNYVLTASDNENWGPTITPSSRKINPGASDNAILSLTIPRNAWANKKATVVVTATSTENTEVSASDNGIARVSVVRGVDVSISPSFQSGTPGMTLTYTVTITNTGNVEDTYDIAVGDNAGWDPEFDLVQVRLAPYGSAVMWYLKVTVPGDAPVGAEDNITITATSTDNAVSDSDSCIAHGSKAEFSLITKFKVALDMDFFLSTGSKLVVRFYNHGNIFENENVIESFVPPVQLVKSWIIPHPENIGVKKIRLDLTTDNIEDVIATITTFTVTQGDLWARLVQIYLEWPFASFERREVLNAEIVDIYLQWPFAPF